MGAIVPLLVADSALVSALGGAHVYTAQASRPVRIPSVEWVLVGDVETEVFNPISVQFDYWSRNPTQAAVIEGRLRALLHRDVRRTIGGVEMSTIYTDSYTQEYPQPGVIHRSVRFQFEPLRRP